MYQLEASPWCVPDVALLLQDCLRNESEAPRSQALLCIGTAHPLAPVGGQYHIRPVKDPVHDLAHTLSRRRKPVPTPHRSFSRRRDLTRQEVETHHVHDDQATTRLAGQSLLHDIDIPPVCRWSCRLGNHCSASSGQPTLMPTFGYHPHPDSGAQPQVGLELIPTSTMQSVFAVRVFHEHCAYGEGFCGHLARLAVSSEP